MKIEEKVTSRELSERMVKLGWDYETERYWYEGYSGWHIISNSVYYTATVKEKSFSASDAIEIELPYRIKRDDKWYDLWIIKHIDNSWIISYANDAERKTLKSFNNKNLSEVFGKMWCYLKENRLI